MQHFRNIQALLVIFILVSSGESFAARGSFMSTGPLREENSMVANGQGISSPSFWDGVSGANPAGLVNNSDFKVQGAAATFDDSTNNLRESGGLFGGNGMIGAGLEYSNFNTGPYPSGQHQINGGLAFTLSPLETTIGVSAHAVSNGGGTSYDLGTLIDLLPGLRVGGMLPDVNNGMHIVAAGFTYSADPMVDFVVDAGYHLQDKDGIVKPGISLHTNILQATAAYGFRFAGTPDDVLVTTKFTAGVGLRLADKILIEYEYRGLPEHRLGLTLRFN